MRFNRCCSVAAFLLAIIGFSCGPIRGQNAAATASSTEAAQQIGDVMASIDEAGGSSGSFAVLEGARKTLARYSPSSSTDVLFAELNLLPSAYAESCLTAAPFGGCAVDKSVTRTFAGCTLGGATLVGSVRLLFSNAACKLMSAADTVRRSPQFTATGSSGITLTVQKSSNAINGQMITRGAGTAFTFSNDGIDRTLRSNGVALFDFTTTTVTDLTITGVGRAGRVISGGSLRVKNNLAGTTCDYVPTNVTYTGTCNCPTSGTWAGTCSNGKTSSMNITGCGTASFVLDSASGTVAFDRCYGS